MYAALHPEDDITTVTDITLVTLDHKLLQAQYSSHESRNKQPGAPALPESVPNNGAYLKFVFCIIAIWEIRHTMTSGMIQTGTAQRGTAIWTTFGAPMICCESCRRKWWNQNREKIKKSPGSIYGFTYKRCGEEFTAYGNSHRQYCSYECYISDRFWDGEQPTKNRFEGLENKYPVVKIIE